MYLCQAKLGNVFRIIPKWKTLALYLYDDGSPAETGPAVVVWVCVL